MEELKEGENLLYIFRKAQIALNSRDIFLLKELSNKTIHNASIYQDTDSISTAVIIYSLSKIMERSKYTYYKDWPFFIKAINSYFIQAISSLEKEDPESFRKSLVGIREAMTKLSGNFRKAVEDVFRRALINKASRMYEHGISMEQTADVLGITMFELSEYSGKTGISDVPLSLTMPIEKRFKAAWEFFK